MIILPKNKYLVNIAEEKLRKVQIPWFDEQYYIDDLIINAHFSMRSCIQLNSDGVIIDGFVITNFNNFLYHDKTFFDLLGGDHTKTPHIANPIDKTLYKVPDDFVQIQPYDVIHDLN